MATSVDGLGVLKETTSDNLIVFSLEMKTMTTNNTAADARQLLAKCQDSEGLQTRFFVTDFGADVFNLLVWNNSYRSQCIHHVAVTGTDHCLFVVADMSSIIYAVLVYFPRMFVNAYQSFIERVAGRYLSFYDQIESSNISNFSHATDMHTVHLWKLLSSALIEHHRQNPRGTISKVVKTQHRGL